MTVGTRVTVGVDLGGTGTRLVALRNDGVVHRELTVPTPRDVVSADERIAELARQIRSLCADTRLEAVGIGASGPIDAAGIIRNPDTLPAFTGLSLTTMLGTTLGVPCSVDNDTVTAAIGENAYGAGNHSRSLLMITLGTGVGVSVLVEGKPFRGADGIHPEAGHIPVTGPAARCYCGLSTCWEQLASRQALDALTGHRTAEVAAVRDPDAVELFAEYGRRVGAGTGALVTIFRPDRIVFGGSAAQYLPLFVRGLEQELGRCGSFQQSVSFAEAALGSLSGAIGAAVMARHPG
ncbi:ROK family glucokinase [Acidothermaceae bacterium B102]|nr:ROK family glucokinase [Acidothermaceae bacterium B102]